MKCNYCGRESEDTDRHCRGCGAHLSVPIAIDEQAMDWEDKFKQLSDHMEIVMTRAHNLEKTSLWASVIAIIEFFIIAVFGSV